VQNISGTSNKKMNISGSYYISSAELMLSSLITMMMNKWMKIESMQ